MFKKVLIVDDHDVVNDGVLAILKRNNIEKVDQAQYCDEASNKIKRAILDESPYDLLITDLSFKSDHRNSVLNSGEELVAALRTDNLELPIIVYSMEDRLQRVRTLINTYHVNAYVCKGRHGASDLEKSLEYAYNKKTYVSNQVEQALSSKTSLEIDNYDIELIKQLSLGLSQSEISKLFAKKGISPRSLSSIEKRLNRLRIQFKANNAIHLVAIVKDLGLI